MYHRETNDKRDNERVYKVEQRNGHRVETCEQIEKVCLIREGTRGQWRINCDNAGRVGTKIIRHHHHDIVYFVYYVRTRMKCHRTRVGYGV